MHENGVTRNENEMRIEVSFWRNNKYNVSVEIILKKNKNILQRNAC